MGWPGCRVPAVADMSRFGLVPCRCRSLRKGYSGGQLQIGLSLWIVPGRMGSPVLPGEGAKTHVFTENSVKLSSALVWMIP